jgi:hypothetical protein
MQEPVMNNVPKETTRMQEIRLAALKQRELKNEVPVKIKSEKR